MAAPSLDLSEFGGDAPQLDLSEFQKPKKAVGALSYIGGQAKAGVGELAAQAGQALTRFGAPNVGKTVGDYGQNLADQNPEEEGRSAITKLAGKAVRMAAPFAPLAAGELLLPAAGATALGLGGAATLGAIFGGSQAQQTYEKAKAAGKSEDEANSLANTTGSIAGLGMGAVGALTGGLAGPAIRGIAGTGAKTAAESLAETAAPSITRPFLADTAGHLVGNVASMAAANAGTAAVEKQAGLHGPTPGEAALEGVESGAGLTAALLPFGLARTVLARRANTAAVNRLQSPDTDPQQRAQIADQIHANLNAIDPEAAGHFADNVTAAINGKQPLELGEHLLGPQEAPPQPAAPLALPAPVVRVDEAGNARMDGIQPPVQDEAPANVIGRAPVQDVTDVEPKPTRSEEMGLDPNAGPISRAAVIAVDSGAHDQAVAQAAQAAVEEAKPKETNVKAAEPTEAAVPREAVPAPAPIEAAVQANADRGGATVAAGAEKQSDVALAKPAPVPPDAKQELTGAKQGIGEPKPLQVGITPGNAESVSVKDGIVHIGKEPALDFNSGEPVKVKDGASDADVKQALKDAGALSRRQKFFGGEQEISDNKMPVGQPPLKPKFGIDGEPLHEGGKPFTNRIAAGKFQKEHNPSGRVVKVQGGFAIRDSSEKEDAARQEAGKRLQTVLRQKAYDENPLKAFIAQHGLAPELAHDFAPGQRERQAANVRGYGETFRKGGLQMDKLAELAAQDGYLPPNDHDANRLYDLVARAIRGERIVPIYAEGQAEKEMQAHIKAQQELHGLEPHDLDASGYERVDPALQAEVRDLIAKAEQGGIDHEGILEDVAKKNQNASTDEYHAAASKALREALDAHASKASAGAQDRSGPVGAQAPEPQGKAEGVDGSQEADSGGGRERSANDGANLGGNGRIARDAARPAMEPSRGESAAGAGRGGVRVHDVLSERGRDENPDSATGGARVAEGLTAPTREDVTRAQDRAANAPALDAKEQIDREAEKQTLTPPVAPEQRKDTTGDLLGGPTKEEALAAKRKADEAKAKPKDDNGTTPMFAHGERTAGGALRTADIRAAIAPALDKLKAPFALHDTAAAAKNATGVEIPAGAKGLYLDGKLHLIAEGIKSPLEAEETFWHEVNHAGVDRIYSAGSKDYYNAMRGLATQNANIREAAKAWLKQFGAADTKGRIADGMTRDAAELRTKLQAVEEALSELAGRNAKINGAVRFIAKVQEFMRAIGLNRLADSMEKMTDAKALSMIFKAREAVMKEPQGERGQQLAPAFSKDGKNQPMASRKDVVGLKAARKHDFKTGEPVTVDALHGTPEGEIAKFRDNERGLWFTDSPALADQYTMRRGMWRSDTGGGAIYPVRLSMQNPMAIDAIGKRHDNIPVPWQQWKPKVFGNLPTNAVSLQDALAYAKEHGHDGIIVRNVVDTAIHGDTTKSTVYAVASPDQVASSLAAPGSGGAAFAKDQHQREVQVDGQWHPIENNKGQLIHPDVQGQRNFWKWADGTKVVDGKGRPLVVYHGTKADVERFSEDNFGEGHGAADWGDGFYFASKPEAANTYAEGEGGNVMPVYLKIRNPADSKVMKRADVQDAMEDDMGFASAREVLQDLGYDGIVIDHGKDGKEYVAFAPDQVKSATGNRGTFDANSANISYSRSLDKISDRIDAIKGASVVKDVGTAYDGILMATNPAARGDAPKEMARTLIAGMGEKEMRSIQFRTKLNAAIQETAKATTLSAKARDLMEKGLTVQADKVFLRNTPEQNHAFMQAMDTGDEKYFAEHPELKPMADVIERMFAEKAKEIQGLGTGALQAIRENYFPHIWNREPSGDKQREIFSGLAKRPLEGRKGFTKERVFEDVRAGLDAGFEPISNNPLDLVALKMEEMDKYILAHKTLSAMEGSNGVHLIAAGEKTPQGFTDVNGRFGSIERDGQKLRYIARDDVAQVINNYLSPSLYHNKYVGKPFTAYMGAANTLNQFQLGVFSAFHAGFTSMEAVISHAAIGVKALTAGDFKGAAKYLGSAPAAWINNPKLGSKIIEHMMDSSVHPEMAPILEGLQLAGFKWQMDNRFRTDATKNMLQAWQDGKKFKAGLNSIPALAEQTARPILEWLVPRQKFGVFGEMYSKWMQDNPKASHEELRNSAQQIWNRVDSRLGQVVYDRLFVHNVAKNFAQMLIRAPGWTGGTILEVGGGIKDLASYAKALASGKRPDSISDRAAYTLSMLMVTATVNAAMTAMFTGDSPQDWRDLVAFRTGNQDEHGRPERFMLPTYMKDVYAYAKAPGTTLLNKSHPLLSLVGDIGRNKDFYGTEIRSEDANILTQLAQTAGFTAKAFVPFWWKGLEKEREREGSALAQAAPLVGVMPAPSDLNKTAAEKLMTKYGADRMPQGSRTQEEADKATIRRQMLLALRKGEQDKAKELFDQGRTQGLFGPRDYLKVVRQARQDPIVSQFSHLTFDQAQRVMKVATDDEKQELAPAFMKKRLAFQRQHQGATD